MISVGQQAARKTARRRLQQPLLTLWELAASAGMATGVVTTTRVTHATPGGDVHAHAPDRNWENDTDLPDDAKAQGCIDIAQQLVESPLRHAARTSLLGGGRGEFMPREQRDPEYDDKVGQRLDGRDLIAEWKQRASANGAYVWNAQQLAGADGRRPLLGLFEPDHMQFEHDRDKDAAGEPDAGRDDPRRDRRACRTIPTATC